jgi:uncharacterized membrane protein
MKIQIVKNKYLNALFLLMLFSAIVHMIILFYLAIVNGNFYIVNYFNILSIGSFFPNIFNSFWGNVFSVVVAVLIYLIILKINKKVGIKHG